MTQPDTQDKPSTSLTESQLLSRCVEFYGQAEYGLMDRLERAEENVRFKRGDQWEDADIVALEEQGKVAVTVNHILPIVKFISGSQRQNRKDPEVLPEHRGLRSVATVLKHLAMHSINRCGGQYEGSEAFEKAVSTVCSWLHWDVDYEAEVNGRLRLRAYDCWDVLEDPAAWEYSIDDSGQYLCFQYYAPKQRMRRMYPKKAADLESDGGFEAFGEAATSAHIHQILSYLLDDPSSAAETTDPRIVANRYRVREFWWKEYVTVPYLLDAQTGMSIDIKRGQARRAKLLIDQFGDRFRAVRRVERVLNQTIVVGSVMVEHTRDPLGGLHFFPFSRFAPFHDGKYQLGFIDNLIGPQREENKRRTNMLHHLGQSVNSGMVIAQADPDYLDYLENFGSKGGVVIQTSKTGGKWDRITPTPLSEGHAAMAQIGAEHMKEISGVANMMGYDSQEKESGRALALRQRQGATIIEGIFDNWDRTMRDVYMKQVELIRRGRPNGTPFYSEDEIRRIVGEENLIGPEYLERAAQELPPPQEPLPPAAEALQIAEVPAIVRVQAVEQFQQQAVQFQAVRQQWEQAVRARAEEMFFAELSDMRTGTYSVTVAESPNAPTARAYNAEILMALAEKFPDAIPPEALIERMDIADADELIEQIKEQRRAMMQQQQVPVGGAA
jgi:hypothetical protein